MENVTSDNERGIAIDRTVSTSETAITISYRIESMGDCDGPVRVVEHLSEPVDRSEVTFGDSDDIRWRYRNNREVAFVTDADATEPIEATLRIAATFDPDDCMWMLVPANGNNAVNDAESAVSETVRTDGEGLAAATDSRSVTTGTDRGVPVVGVAATDDNIAGVARTTLRAIERDLPVFVAVDARHDMAAVKLAQRLGATVIRPDVSDPTSEDLSTALAVAAREHSYPGVVFNDDCRTPVAFEESLNAFERADRTVVNAVPKRAKTSVLAAVPAYNEAGTVGSVVESARSYVDEVLVVDDGSTDETAVEAREAGATVVELGLNRGYGYALKTIFQEAAERNIDHLIVLDGDDQHDPTDIPRLLAHQQESGAEIVVGNRFDDEDTDVPAYRRLGLWCITLLVNLSMGTVDAQSRIRDTQSGFRAYDDTAVESLAENADVIGDRMGASLDILYHARANRFVIEEVPTTISYDVSDANAHNPVVHGVSLVNTVFRTLERKRPFAMLGVPGFAALLGGAGLGYLAISTAPGAPQVGLAGLSVVSLFVGILFSISSVVHRSLQIHLDGST